MLNRVRLVNFRKVTDDTMTFTQGINLIRGGNEASKSTRLEAIAYALFGSRALRTPLEQAVTWGEAPKTLRVELALTMGGKLYTFVRSAKGAEVILDGRVFCTGQNEVTLLATSLIGADATTASNLLMASQGSIRGALEQGPKALSTLIEDLAGFSTFDQILEAASEKLALGSPGMLEERLKGATATLAAATESLPPKPDEKAHMESILSLENKAHRVGGSIPELASKVDATDKAWKDASALYLKKNELEVSMGRALSALTTAKKQVDALAVEAHKSFDMGTLDILKERVAFAEDYGKLVAAHKLFLSLPDDPRFNGPIEEYQTVREDFTEFLRRDTAELSAINEKILSAAARRMNHDKCDKCGQDITHLESVVKTNAEVDAELKDLAPKREKAEAALLNSKEAVAALDRIRAHADRIQPTLNKLHPYVTLDEATYPATVTWVSEVPTDDVPDLAHARRQLSAAELTIKAIEAAKAKFEMATEQAGAAELAHEAAVDAHAKFEAPDADTIIALTDAKDHAALTLGGAKGDVLLINQEINNLKQAHASAVTVWASAQARITDAEKVIADCRKDLDSLGFNNALLKRIRQIRPLIANKLWNTVLASVSVMFTQMRGEESWVSKEKSGFCVNGQAVESLSGSTLDILGLAIRASLLRTFLPQCGLLVLDEPCAAMDETRTDAMLGFLKSVDFQQTLLVSHEEVSESVADNLIQL